MTKAQMKRLETIMRKLNELSFEVASMDDFATLQAAERKCREAAERNGETT